MQKTSIYVILGLSLVLAMAFTINNTSLIVTAAPNPSTVNVKGWAWSSTIGWTSFNSGNPPGTALNFNESGEGGSGEFVYIADTNFNLSELTVEAWIKPQTSTDQRAPIVRIDRWYFQVFENNRLATYWYGWDPAGYHYSSVSSIEMNKWTHVAVVWESGSVKFYINGELDTTIPSSGVGDSTNWVLIGQENSTRRYNGMIDDVRIWDGPRTQQQIRENMSMTIRDGESGLVGYWKFYEGSGSTVADSSLNGNTGTISGATWVKQHDYGVNIEQDGNLNGYAWSENVGWIHFDPAGVYPQSPDYSARVDIYGDLQGCGEIGWVCGWVRACSVFDSNCGGSLDPNRGDWDGWIFFGPSGASPGLWLEEDGELFNLRGYAWGDEVVGWMSFNCNDGGNCSQRPYATKTSFRLNSPPEVTNASSTIRYCDHHIYPQVATGVTVTLDWDYYDRDGDLQDKYEIHVSESPSFIDRFEKVAEVSASSYSLDLSEDSSWKSELDFGTTYYWRVRVHDTNFWSEWSENEFTIAKTHASPFVIFSHSPEQVSVGEVVTFDAEKWDDDLGQMRVSQVYDGSTPIYNWTFSGGNPPTASSSSTATTTFEDAGEWSATLQLTDASGYSCSRFEGLDIKVPLPDWREVTPFGRAKIFLAEIMNRFLGRTVTYN